MAASASESWPGSPGDVPAWSVMGSSSAHRRTVVTADAGTGAGNPVRVTPRGGLAAEPACICARTYSGEVTTVGLGLPGVRTSHPRTDPARPDDPRLVDKYGRVATDLRVSLTDRCNLRCSYCMPEDGLEWLADDLALTDDEVVRLVTVAVRDLGVDEVRFTGGEPLLRKGLEKIVEQTTALTTAAGLPVSTSLTTNALGLTRRAAGLAAAGLERLNVSLDTLSPQRFEAITRRDRHADVLAGLAAARAAGLSPIKVNAVLLRGTNDDEAPDLLRWALQEGYELRIIEQMPLDAQGGWDRDEMVTAAEVLAALSQRFALTPMPAADRGAAPAERFAVAAGDDHPAGTVGIIASVTRSFCGACDRTRLTADGQLRDCLFARGETDLRALLRGGAGDAEIADVWRQAMWRKRAGHGIDDPVVRAARPPDERDRRLRVLQVRYYAGAAAAAGVEEEPVELPPGGDVAALRTHLAGLRPALVAVLAVSTVLVDGVPASDPARTLDGATRVDVLPPFAGG